MKRRVRLIAILLVAVALGSLREFLFVNLNYQIDHAARHTPYSYAHSAFQGWVKGWDAADLLRLKWLLAAAFSGAMLGLTILFARILEAGTQRLWAIALVFGSVGGVALLCHGLGGRSPVLQVLSVKLLHLLQYPVLLFFVWAALFLADQRGRGSAAQ